MDGRSSARADWPHMCRAPLTRFSSTQAAGGAGGGADMPSPSGISGGAATDGAAGTALPTPVEGADDDPA